MISLECGSLYLCYHKDAAKRHSLYSNFSRDPCMRIVDLTHVNVAFSLSLASAKIVQLTPPF